MISKTRLKSLSSIEISEGILNPFSGSVVITYEPSKIDIEKYLKNLSRYKVILDVFGIDN